MLRRYHMRGLAAVLTTLLLIVSFTSNAYAGYQNSEEPQNIDSIGNKVMSYEYAYNSLTTDEQKYLAKNPKLAAKRAEKDAKYLLNLMEQEMDDNMDPGLSPDVTILTTTVPIGSDTTIYTFDTGNKGGSWSGLAAYGANYSAAGKWADVSCQAWGLGNAGAWAWVGPIAYISGSGSRTANIIFSGQGTGSLSAFIGAAATGRIRVSIWDYTLGAEIDGTTVWERTASNYEYWSVTGPFTAVVQCTLQAGHTYALRFGVATSTSAYGVTNAYADFWNDGPGPEGLDGFSVKIDFI
ncbi:MAG: hypothetical protein AB1426_13155 [Bacillota bacterium]